MKEEGEEEEALSEGYLTNHNVATSDQKRDERVSLLYNTYIAL